jgi:GMP synthase (glutamine-hydrolysing)
MEGSTAPPPPPGELLRKPEMPTAREVVYILDGGAQYALDIEQQLKRQGFYAERVPFETPLENLQDSRAVILSGGPESVYDPEAPGCDPRLLEPRDDRPPVLGICYGAQLINHARGGSVVRLEEEEYGTTAITIDSNSVLFRGLALDQEALMSHGDTMVELAPGFEVVARSGDMVAAIANPDERLYGFQFHPEVSTAEGPAMLRNFLQNVAGMEANYTYTYEEFVEDAVQEVREQADGHQVLAFISGGVDSAALAALLEKALPSEQLFLIYVNNGFMRQGESEYVQKTLAGAGIQVQVFDGTDMFLTGNTVINGVETPPLYQVTDPEIKRKIIGDIFIKVQERMGAELGLDTDNFKLAMGTLYTDLIESGSKHASDKAAVIKSHHNDTELVRRLREAGRVIEPWRYLQKDDVRAVGKLLGLPAEIYERQPFPGPGLAIRAICAERPYIPPDFDLVTDRLSAFDMPEITTCLLPVQTVGVQGDHRTYGHLAGLSGKMDWPELIQLARTIPRQIRSINRVVYLFGGPVSGGLDQITPTHLTPDVIEQLRAVDAIVNQRLKQHGLDRSISQVPVVSFPVPFGEPGARSIGIRTIMTPNFKTGDIAVPGKDFPEEVLLDIVHEITKIPGIARIAYDLTSKPPATTEWE